MSRRYYSDTAAIAYTTNSLNNTDTESTISLQVPLSGWPGSTPFLAALDKGTATEEVVLITAVSGSNVTATRGYDGTPKRTHGIGATLQHVAAAIDYDEANAHVNGNSGVHGVAGSVVGTTDAQTLTNKTLTAPTIGDFTNSQHDHSAASHGGAIPQASITNLTTDLAALESITSHNADITTVNNTITTNDDAAVHKAGTETITGDKTFSGGASVAGLTVSGASNVETTVGHTGIKKAWFSAAFSLSNATSTSVTIDWSSASFASIIHVNLTVVGGSNYPVDARMNSGYTTSNGTAFAFTTGSNITGSFTLLVEVIGT